MNHWGSIDTSPRRSSASWFHLGEECRQLLRFGRAQAAKEGTFGLLLQLDALHTGASARRGEDGETRPPIVRIRLAFDESIGLEPIDELRDVRLHAGEPLGELAER